MNNGEMDEWLNCWEYMNCSQNKKDACDIFRKDKGKTCWLFMNNNPLIPDSQKNYHSCINCPFFKLKKSSLQYLADKF